MPLDDYTEPPEPYEEDMEYATCTNCASVESVGFYTGCMIADGHCKETGWKCDGRGNLSRRARLYELSPADIEGTPEEVIKRLAGKELMAMNGWGKGVVVGAWILRRPNEGPHLRLLLACPSSNNPVQLFNEDARDYLHKS